MASVTRLDSVLGDCSEYIALNQKDRRMTMMGSGKDRSPSPVAMEILCRRVPSRNAAMIHKQQRNEVLEGEGSPRVHNLSTAPVRTSSTNMSPRTPTRTADSQKQQARPQRISRPRGGTPMPSSSTTSPVPSPKQPVHSGGVNFPETVVGPAPSHKSPSIECERLQDNVSAVKLTTSLEIAEEPQRSPFSSRRFNLELVPPKKETLVLPETWIPDILEAAQQKGFPISPDWTVRRGIDVVEIEEPAEIPVSRPSVKANRSSSRRARTEMEETQDGCLGVGHKNRATRRSHSRQQKRKACDSVSTLPLVLLPESYPLEEKHHVQQAPDANRRRHARETRNEEESLDWLQIADIILWRHVPRSALLFGVGCFCILSASMMQDLQYSIITVLAYLALVYLALVFFQRSFRHRAITQASTCPYEISEADANKVIRLLLPVINIMLSKLSELFSGEPAMTLKVAAALWLLAQAGSIMGFWTLARLAYFSMFIVPKCYSCYHAQLHGHVRNILLWGWETWDSCSHKKAVLLAAFVAAWHFSSISCRICGAFTFIVAFRAFHHSLKIRQIDKNIMKFKTTSGVNYADSHGLQLVRTPESAQLNHQVSDTNQELVKVNFY